jgi:nicotinamide/nicotinate riboside kinase
VDSKEDLNSVGKCPISDAKISEMKNKVQGWLQPGKLGHEIFTSGNLKMCLFDGFLLYCKEMQSIIDLIDIKFFLLVSRLKATQRREARDGYVTLEGFWADPPGYVDKIVWPNYAAAHAWLFEDGDVQGNLNKEVLGQAGISAQVGVGSDIDMAVTLEWVVDTIILELEKKWESTKKQ